MFETIGFKNIVIIVLALILIVWLVSKQQNKYNDSTQAVVKKVSGDEARAVLKDKSNAKLIDVRSVGEYEQGHIKNSTLIPLHTIKNEVEKKIPSKDTPLILYCRSGNRTKQAIDILLDLGYTEIYDMGSMGNW